MTTTPTRPTPRFQIKVRPAKWDESEHPRDRKGRFIETGAEVRIWGGGSGKVVGNLGNGRIEVERSGDGKRIIVHRNYLTVTARPNGAEPTDEEDVSVEAAPVTQASADAEEVPELADGEGEALPDRGTAPDRLVAEVPGPGTQVGEYTVGEYVDGPSSIDGWVVGVTESGGPIVRTEDGKDWPLLPDAQMARAPEDAPEMPREFVEGDALDNFRLPEGQRRESTPDEQARQAATDLPGDLEAERQRALAEMAPAEVKPIDSLNPSSSGVFEDYESGREYRATAPLADNIVTLAETTEDVGPDDVLTVYRGVPDDAPAGLQPGDFVTTNEQLARDYMGGQGRIETAEVRYRDVLDALDEPNGEEYIYRPQATREGPVGSPRPPATAEADPNADLRAEVSAAERALIDFIEAQPDPTAMSDRERANQDRMLRSLIDNEMTSDAVRTVAQTRVDALAGGGDAPEGAQEPRGVIDVSGRPDPAGMSDADLQAEHDELDLPLGLIDEQGLAQAEQDMSARPVDTPGVAAMRERRNAISAQIDTRLTARRSGIADRLNDPAAQRARLGTADNDLSDDEDVVADERQQAAQERVDAGQATPVADMDFAAIADELETLRGRETSPRYRDLAAEFERRRTAASAEGERLRTRETDQSTPVADMDFGAIAEEMDALAANNGMTSPRYRELAGEFARRQQAASTEGERLRRSETPPGDDDAPAPDTDRKVEVARREGYLAYMNDEMRSPAMNATVMDMLADAKVGDESNVQIMEAFTQGYERAIDDDLAGQLRVPDALDDDEEELPEGAIGAPSKGVTTTITLPDGSTAKRTSKGRAYTHVVISEPATPEARKAAYERRAKELEAEADTIEAALADPRVVRKSRGFSGTPDPGDFNGYEAGLVGTEVTVNARRSRYGGGGRHTYFGIGTRCNERGESEVPGRKYLPEGVEVIREEPRKYSDEPYVVVRTRDLILAEARAKVDGNREQAAKEREEGAKPDPGGYGVLRWTSSAELGRKASQGELSYEAERYGRTIKVVPVDATDETGGELRNPNSMTKEEIRAELASLPDGPESRTRRGALMAAHHRLWQAEKLERDRANAKRTPVERFTHNGVEWVKYEDGGMTQDGKEVNAETYDLARGLSRVEPVSPPDDEESLVSPSTVVDAESARRHLEGLAASDMKVQQMLDSPSLGFSDNGRIAYYKRGQSPDWTLVDVNTGLSLGTSVAAPGGKRDVIERANAVAALPFPWDDSREAVKTWRSESGRTFAEEMYYAAGAVDDRRGRDTSAAAYYRSQQIAPDGGDGETPERPEPKVITTPQGVTRLGRRPADLRPGDRVHTSGGGMLRETLVQADPTASGAPGGGSQLYPFGNQIRTIDRIEGDKIIFTRDEGTTQDRWASIDEFLGTRDVMGRTTPDKTVLVEPDEPSSGAFDVDTDPRLSELQAELAIARDPATSDLESLGRYNRAVDMVGGYRAGTRGGTSFTPEEHERLRVYRGELVEERQRVADERRARRDEADAEPAADPNDERLAALEARVTDATATTGPTGDPVHRATGIVNNQRVAVVETGYDRSERRYEVTRPNGGEMWTFTDRAEALAFIRGDEDPDATPQPPESNDVDSTPNGQYSVGDTVEVQIIDSSQPGYPKVWRRGTIDRITLDPDNNLSDVFVVGEDGERLPTQRVGPRGGNGKIRPLADEPEPGPDPDVDPGAGAPPIPTPRAAADFITAALVGNDPLLRDSIHAALNPTTRAVNGIYGAEGLRNIERHPDADKIMPYLLTAYAGITSRNRRRVWDGDRAQDALNRLLANDPTLPANSVGQRVSIEVLDMDAPIRYGQPAAQKRVEGVVESVSDATMRNVFVRIIDDSGESHVQAFRPDAYVNILDEPARPAGAFPQGTEVEARQPGIEAVTRGTVLDYTDNGMVRVQYRDRLGGMTVGTFNPAHVTAVSGDTAPAPTPDVYALGEGEARVGDVIVSRYHGGAVELTDVSRQNISLTSFDGYSQANPVYGEGDVERILSSYRTATPEEAEQFRARLARARGGPEPEPDLPPPAPLPDVDTESVSASDLAVGDKVIFEDGTVATIEDIGDADGLVELEYRDADGLAGSYFADPGTIIERINDPDPTPPEPEENPEAEVGREAQVLGGNLLPGDRIWAGRDKVEVTEVEPYDADTVLVTIRFADRHTETMPFGRNAVLDRADDPFLPDPSPLPDDAQTSRPVLYTYQRRNIVALGLDNDPDPMVAEAARRIRTRKPLAAAHSEALATRLSEMSTADGVKPQRARMLARLAAANNAASIEAGGRGVDLPPLPNAGSVTKTNPTGVGVGDQIAFVGVGGRLTQGKVTNLRKMMSGRLTEVTVEHDGVTSTMLLSKGTDVYVLPDLPDAEPVPQPEGARTPEFVDVGDLRVGDRIRIPNNYSLFDAERERTEATVVEQGVYEGGMAYVVLDVHSVDSNDDEQRMVLNSDTLSVSDAYRQPVIRLARGDESADQPRDRDLPPINPTEVNASEVQVGDWLVMGIGSRGSSTQGIVTAVEVVNGPEGERIGQRFLLRTVHGGGNWITVTDAEDYKMTRLIAADQNTVLRLAEQKRERERYSRAIRVSQAISEPLDQYTEMMHFRIVQQALHGGGIDDAHYDARINEAFDGGDSTTDLTVDQARAIGRMTTNLQAHLSGQSGGPEFAAVRDAAAQLAEAIVNDHHERMRTALLNVQPTQPGETRTAAGIDLARRIFRPEAFGTPNIEQRDLMALARGVVAAREARDAAERPEGESRDYSVPKIPDGSLADRMAAYKQALPSRFGTIESEQVTYGNFDLDSLERGEVPELRTAIGRAKKDAVDGGPGAEAMAQLEVLRGAGADVAAAIDRRLAETDPNLNEAAIEAAKVNKDAAYNRYKDLMRSADEWYEQLKDEYAQDAGYDSFADLSNYGNSDSYTERRDLRARILREIRDDERMVEANRQHQEAMSQFRTFAQQTKDLAANLAAARAKATRDVMAEIREMGGHELKYTGAGRRQMETTDKPLRNGETMKAMRYAEQQYPKEWLEALGQRRPLSIGTSARGFFQGGAWIIRLSKDDNRNNESGWVPPRGRVATHELGHAMETVIPGLPEAERAFLWSRTSTGEPGERQRTKRKRIDSSTSYVDEFKEAYSGKDYADGTHYELFTTGMESLFAGSDYIDEDYRNWMLGTLALL